MRRILCSYKTIIFFILLICISHIFNNIYGQGFPIKKIENVKRNFHKKQEINYHNVEEELPKDHVKDGSVDYTSFVQKAINQYKNVELPNFPILISDKGLKLQSNSKIYFNKNSKFILKPTSKERYAILLLDKVRNVSIYNPNLIGDRNDHKGKSGEWGMGIRIQDSKNINIYNVEIKDMWGDGIYITSYKKNATSDIYIKAGQIDNVRRNGISIISGRSITIDNLLISNTNGTRPTAGIDIEPNNSDNYLDQIALNNIHTYNNERNGIFIHLNKLLSPKEAKNVNISIFNHKDEFSRNSFAISEIKKQKSRKKLKGEIKIRQVNWNPRMAKKYIIPKNEGLLPLLYLEK